MNFSQIARVLFTSALLMSAPAFARAADQSTSRASFSVDPGWPLPLPDRWVLGHVTGVAVDQQNRVWVLNRPATITEDEAVIGAVAAPPVVIFDQRGQVVASWPLGKRGETWPHREHSIAIDSRDGSVWISGNGDDDGFIVKYSADGRFLLRVGNSGPSKGSNDTTQLGRVAGMVVDPVAGELFIADGYGNRRVIVLDATTGTYKRHWGAFGRAPIDGPVTDRKSQLMQPHGIALSRDGILYVGDRPNNRLQTFTRDGKWIADIVQRPETGGGTGGKSGSVGSVWDAVLWPRGSEKNLLVVDGNNSEVRVSERKSGKDLSAFGRAGPYPGEFRWAHTIAVDANGNIYVGEVSTGKRVQRFRPNKKK